MSQIFPIKVRTLVQSPFDSRDSNIIAIGDDGMDYMVKHGKIAASEFICYKIFQSCGVSVPEYSMLIMPSGEIVFGSRIVVDMKCMMTPPQEKIEYFFSCKKVISSIIGLDLFVWNEDRHLGNFLFFKGFYGDVKCQAIDFSRAFIASKWPENDLLSFPNNTIQARNYFKTIGVWENDNALNALLNLSRITVATWNQWIDTIPPSWLGAEERILLKNWWNSEDFIEHQDKCIHHTKHVS